MHSSEEDRALADGENDDEEIRRVNHLPHRNTGTARDSTGGRVGGGHRRRPAATTANTGDGKELGKAGGWQSHYRHNNSSKVIESESDLDTDEYSEEYGAEGECSTQDSN